MKKLLLLLPLLALAGCEMGGYDEGTGEYSMLTGDFVEAHTNAECAVDYALTDGGDSLALTPAVSVSWAVRPDTMYRAVLYYDRSEGSSVRPRSLAAVPVLSVQPAVQLDSVQTDPVDLESAWLSASGRYLNMGLYLKTGEGDDADAHHTVGMVCDSVTMSDSGASTAHLRLYHDQGGVPEYYSSKTYVSIARRAIPADSVALTVNTYDGTVTRRFRLSEQ